MKKKEKTYRFCQLKSFNNFHTTKEIIDRVIKFCKDHSIKIEDYNLKHGDLFLKENKTEEKQLQLVNQNIFDDYFDL